MTQLKRSLVLAAATSTFFVNTFHMFRTAKLRKASNIPYPNAYATHEQAEKDVNAYRFNCGMPSLISIPNPQPQYKLNLGLRTLIPILLPSSPTSAFTMNQQTNQTNHHSPAQRAHANFIENQPTALGALLISGLHFPVAAAVLGATWSVGRTLYLYGYTSSAGPKGRTL